MTGLLAEWTSFPGELEIAVGVLLLAIVVAAAWTIVSLIRTESGAHPLRSAVHALVTDSLRWIGAIALLLAVFGFLLGMEPGLARMAVDPDHQYSYSSFEESHRRLARLLGGGATTCALGFVLSWWLSAWVGRRRSR